MRTAAIHTPAALASLAGLLALSTAPASAAPPVFWEPVPYLSMADIPAGFYAGNVPGFLDTLEDGALDGQLSANKGSVIGPGQFDGLRDSVDADDGSIDGSGVGGHSFFFNGGAQGITFTFTGTQLPTAFGLVWTDGFGDVTFSAVDGNGVSLGSITRGGFADPAVSGATAEDRFFGLQYDGGIRSVSIVNSGGGGIEIDHLQYGGTAPVPEPASWALMLGGAALLRLRSLRRPA